MAKRKSKSQKNTQQKPQKKFSEKEYLRSRMRSLPIGKCYIGPESPDASEVTVFVTRMHPAGTVSVGVFLVDKYCCGVKDTFYRFSVHPDDLQDLIRDHDNRFGIRDITYNEAHNLIYGAVEYAESVGIPPHKDFDDTCFILAEDDDNIPLIEYEYGRKGRPTLICSNPVEIDHYRKLMLKVLKPEDFDVIFLGPKPDERDWEDEENDDVEYEEVTESYWTDGTNKYPTETIQSLSKDVSQQIRDLDEVRKTAYFIIMQILAKNLPDRVSEAEAFVTSTERAINHYRKYSEAAFGECAELLVKTVDALSGILSDGTIVKMEEGQADAIFNFLMGYNHAVRGINLIQKPMLSNIIDNKDNTEKVLISYLYVWVDSHLAELRYEMALETKPESEPEKPPFRPVGLKFISGKWAGKTVRSRVRKMKIGFVSKDPANYYKRKVRETLATNFANEEDFVGLIYTLSNQVFNSQNLVDDGEGESAFHLLRNIVVETLWGVCSHDFDQWIDNDEDTRAAFSVVLSNAVTMLANIVWRDMIERRELFELYREVTRLSIALPMDYMNLVDLFPLRYSLDRVLFDL